jgi:hypothetical protein
VERKIRSTQCNRILQFSIIFTQFPSQLFMGGRLVRSRLYTDCTLEARVEKLPMFRFEAWCQSVESKLFHYLLTGGWEGGIKASSLNKVSRAELHVDRATRLVSRRGVLSNGEGERAATDSNIDKIMRQGHSDGNT